MANKIKKGDEWLSFLEPQGSKGKTAGYPSKNRVIVEGVNLIKKHERKTQDNPQGSIVERELIHYSNVKKTVTAK